MTEQIFPTEEHRATLLGTLKLLSTARVIVEFSGSGDCGSIERVAVLDHNGAEVDLTRHELDWITTRSTYKDNKWVETSTPEVKGLGAIIEQVAYAAIESTNLDWYNNEGGQGEFTIDFATSPPTINLEIGINYARTEDYSFNFSGTEDETEGDEACTPTTTA